MSGETILLIGFGLFAFGRLLRIAYTIGKKPPVPTAKEQYIARLERFTIAALPAAYEETLRYKRDESPMRDMPGLPPIYNAPGMPSHFKVYDPPMIAGTAVEIAMETIKYIDYIVDDPSLPINQQEQP